MLSEDPGRDPPGQTRHPQVIAYLIDYRLGERTGLELIREAFAARPVAPVRRP